MRNIHTSVVKAAHPYTRSSTPWIMDAYKSVYGRLIHYISGGGMQTFGRTVRQEETRCKQNRFFAVVTLIFLSWFVLLVI